MTKPEQAAADAHFMRLALRLARRGRFSASPNPAVGCVLVKDGRILGAGYHHRAGQPHAEIMALSDAGGPVRGATCYVTLEPCSHYGRTPPCADRLVAEGIARCVIATTDPNPQVSGRGIARLEAAGIAVTVGVREQEARDLNRAFLKAIATAMPYVTVKAGMSLDARTALASGESKWITGPRARSAVQKLRAQSDLILTGSGTVEADDPALNVRFGELPAKIRLKFTPEEINAPARAVLDSHGRLNPERYQIFGNGRTFWCTAAAGETVEITAQTGDLTRLAVPAGPDGRVDLRALLQFFGAQGIRQVLVEAGSRLSAAVLDADLADELVIFAAPKILGPAARPAFPVQDVPSLAAVRPWQLAQVKRLDDDVMLVYRHGDRI